MGLRKSIAIDTFGKYGTMTITLLNWKGDNVKAILKSSLWLVGLGLMLASSGIDGAYMSRIMPEGWGWLGLVLNTTADISGMVIMYFYGYIRRENAKNTKKWKLARWLLFAEVFSVAYAWFFGWRQLKIVMLPIEGDATFWIAPIAASFIPMTLGFVGFAQSLLVDESQDEPQPKATKTQPTKPKMQPAKVAQPKEEKKESNEKSLQVAKLNETAKGVLRSFAAKSDATQQQVADDIGVSRTTVSNYLSKLEQNGFLHKDKNGNVIVAKDLT